jgi:hypothetical protein
MNKLARIALAGYYYSAIKSGNIDCRSFDQSFRKTHKFLSLQIGESYFTLTF